MQNENTSQKIAEKNAQNHTAEQSNTKTNLQTHTPIQANIQVKSPHHDQIELHNRNNAPLWEKRIIIVGTSHVSTDSTILIEEALKKYNPDLVCLELDAQRFDALLHNRESKFSFKIVKQVGLFGAMFVLIAGSVQKYIAKKLGAKPGLDMMHGYHKGKEMGAKVALVDQPMQTTLRRFSKQFKKREIWRMFIDTIKGFFGKSPIPMFDVHKVPNQELVNKIVIYVKNRFPSIYKTLLHERNIYMTDRLIKLNEQFHTIVVVVGAAHKKEMEQLLNAQHHSTN
jgi:pheromone shutdown protein TraB